MQNAWVGFGSNLGDGIAVLDQAIDILNRRGHTVLRCSDIYQSEPWGGAEGGTFTNAVIEVIRTCSPSQFLRDLLMIEAELGRNRERPLTARSCDLDLLFWGNDMIHEPELIVPHPRLHLRNFVLVPMCDLIRDAVHPSLGRSISDLLADCPDPLHVWRIRPSHFPPLT